MILVKEGEKSEGRLQRIEFLLCEEVSHVPEYESRERIVDEFEVEALILISRDFVLLLHHEQEGCHYLIQSLFVLDAVILAVSGEDLLDEVFIQSLGTSGPLCICSHHALIL